MAKTIDEWLHEGEDLYVSALKEYQELEKQIADLEQRLNGKQQDVNQLAQIIGKPLVEGKRRVTAQLVDTGGTAPVSNPPSTIARALAGRTMQR